MHAVSVPGMQAPMRPEIMDTDVACFELLLRRSEPAPVCYIPLLCYQACFLAIFIHGADIADMTYAS